MRIVEYECDSCQSRIKEKDIWLSDWITVHVNSIHHGKMKVFDEDILYFCEERCAAKYFDIQFFSELLGEKIKEDQVRFHHDSKR